MSLLINTAYRSTEEELMDDLSLQGEQLRDTLDKIAVINKRLGGNSISLNGIEKILKGISRDKTIRIIDLGCGNGDMLREAAKYGRTSGYNFDLIGVDANEFTIDHAKKLSQKFPEIKFYKLDVFNDEFRALEYDIALATLFLHHFSENQIIDLLSDISSKAKLGIVINDLHRHKLAYYLFKILSLAMNNSMVTHDGLLSILKGFKKKELEVISKKIKKKSSIKWKWAFRYQWIIQS